MDGFNCHAHFSDKQEKQMSLFLQRLDNNPTTEAISSPCALQIPRKKQACSLMPYYR